MHAQKTESCNAGAVNCFLLLWVFNVWSACCSFASQQQRINRATSVCNCHSNAPYNLVYKAHFFSHRKKAKVGGAPYTRVQQNPTFIFSVIRSGMLPRFISDAKDKHPTFIFTVIRSGMLPRFISDAKDKHPTFIFTVIRSRMLPRFISDAKDKHPTFIFAIIRSRIFPSFIIRGQEISVHAASPGNCNRRLMISPVKH